MEFNNYLVSYTINYNISTCINKNIYIDTINILSDNHKKVIIFKIINIDNIFFCYIIDDDITITILCKEDIKTIIYLNNVLLIISQYKIIKIYIKNQDSYTYTYDKILNDININLLNIIKYIKFDHSKANLLPEVSYIIEELYNLINIDDIDIQNVKKEKYKNIEYIHCYLNLDMTILLQFKLFDKELIINTSNKKCKYNFKHSIYDLFIINSEYFIVQYKKNYYILNSNYEIEQDNCYYIDIINFIKNI